MKEIIDNLKGKEIIYEHSIEILKNYIAKKYPGETEVYRARVFADAIHKIIDDHIKEFNSDKQKVIKRSLLTSAVDKNSFEINAYDIMKTCVNLEMDEEDFLDDLSIWLNNQQDIPVKREALMEITHMVEEEIRKESMPLAEEKAEDAMDDDFSQDLSYDDEYDVDLSSVEVNSSFEDDLMAQLQAAFEAVENKEPTVYETVVYDDEGQENAHEIINQEIINQEIEEAFIDATEESFAAMAEEPETSDETVTFEEPEAFDEPVTFEEPEAFEEPETSDEPEEPVTFEEPEAFVEPEVFEEPEAFEEPETFEEPEAFVEPEESMTEAEALIVSRPKVKETKETKEAKESNESTNWNMFNLAGVMFENQEGSSEGDDAACAMAEIAGEPERPVIKVEMERQLDVLKEQEETLKEPESLKPSFKENYKEWIESGRYKEDLKTALPFMVGFVALVLVLYYLVTSVNFGPADPVEPTESLNEGRNSTIEETISETTVLSTLPTKEIVEDGMNLHPSIRYKEINKQALLDWLENKNSLLVESEYFNTVMEVAEVYGLNPLLLFAIMGQEQGFIPRDHDYAKEIINNPFNVYGSWKDYNTNLRESAMIAARTIHTMSEGLQDGADPIKWINDGTGAETGGYAEDENWHVGVSLILNELESVAGD